MLYQFVFVYLMIDVFCLFFSLVIYSKITIDMGTEREVRALRGLIITFCVFLVIDAVWAMCYYDSWLVTDAAAGVVEAVTMLLMGTVAFFWFLYAENRLAAPYINARFFVPCAAIPIALVAVLDLLTPLTGWMFSIGPEHSFIEGPLAGMPMFVFLVYVVYPAVHALVRARSERSRTRRGEQLTLVAFVVLPAACGVLDMFVHGMPVMAVSVFSSVLLVFLNTQDSRINTDALTGLNNRRRAVEYIEDSLAGGAGGRLFGVFMIDVDYFKEINDSRGHGGGDEALRIIAEGLRHAMAGRRGLASRWGGDEFLVAMFIAPPDQPQAMKLDIQREIDAACERNGFDEHIQVSVGHALAQDGAALSELVAQADRELYAEKAEHHASQEKPR